MRPVEEGSWDEVIGRMTHPSRPRVRIADLAVGDDLIVRTEHTEYWFKMQSGRMAVLQTNRENRPSGEVVLRGCVFGGSSSIAPEEIFCGGNLEFSYYRGEKLYTTTAIQQLVHQKADGTPGDSL